VLGEAPFMYPAVRQVRPEDEYPEPVRRLVTCAPSDSAPPNHGPRPEGPPEPPRSGYAQ